MENFNINSPHQQKSILKQKEVKFYLCYVEDFYAIDFMIEKKFTKIMLNMRWKKAKRKI